MIDTVDSEAAYCIVCKGGMFRTLPSHGVCKRSATTWYLLSVACAPSAITHMITADISSITMTNDSTCGLLPIIWDAQQISSVVAQHVHVDIIPRPS